MIDEILILTFSYLMGAIPFGAIIGWYFGKDPRKHGSGNIGATNMVRVLGKKVGALVFVLDFLKCFAMVVIAKHFYGDGLAVAAGYASIIGHMFSLYLAFKGGKGVTSAVGLYFGLNYNIGILFIIVWFVAFKITRYSFLASIASCLCALLVIYFYYNIQIFLSLLTLTLVIIFKHRENISRFINKSESRF